MTTIQIPHIIESCGFCRAEEVKSLCTMKTGMTNRSYSFYVQDRRYIIRIPGESTELLIDRARECAVYNVISPLDICEPIHYLDPMSGIKIASYLENAHVCDKSSRNDVRKCMTALRGFHHRRLYVEYAFDIWERLAFYESLWCGEESFYGDYRQVKKNVLSLRHYIDAQPKERVLCHIDAVPDNFMFIAKKDGDEEIRLIDWEYARMQDPHLDVAMFAVYTDIFCCRGRLSI